MTNFVKQGEEEVIVREVSCTQHYYAPGAVRVCSTTGGTPFGSAHKHQGNANVSEQSLQGGLELERISLSS